MQFVYETYYFISFFPNGSNFVDVDDRKHSLNFIYKSITNYKNKCKTIVVTCKINHLL